MSAPRRSRPRMHPMAPSTPSRRRGFASMKKGPSFSRDVPGLAVPSPTGGKSGNPRCTFGFEDPGAVVPLPLDGDVLGYPVLQVNGSPVRARTELREARDLLRHFFGGTTCLARGHHSLAQADAQ